MRTQDAPCQSEWRQRLIARKAGLQALLPAAVLASTFLVYAATLSFGFVFDDHVLVVTNDSIRSWRYFPSYFTSHIWSFRYPHLLANYYRPLFLTWLRLNDMLFGLNPWGWHLTSVMAHVAVTWLVYRLSLRLSKDRWVAGAAGFIFGLHPIHAEAVADITSIQEPLSTLFILGAILTFACSREQVRESYGFAERSQRHLANLESSPRWSCHKGWLAASMALTAGALLSKESGMVVPVLIGGYVWIYGRTEGREMAQANFSEHFFPRLGSALAVSVPFWAVVLTYVPLRVWALKGFAHTVTPLTLRTAILTIPSVLTFYLGKLLTPINLSCYYDLQYVSAATVSNVFLPLAGILVALAAMVAWYLWARRASAVGARTIAFASWWMAMAILPVLNFRLLPEGEIAHDRYLYLPSVGFSLLMAVAVVQWSRARQYRTRQPAILAALAVAVFLGMGFATARQTLFWSDDLTLNFRAHQIAPRNVYATTSLASAVAQCGMEGPAMALYQQALATKPKFWRANVNLGYLYYARGNYREAARFFARACAADPTDGDQFLYRGMSLLRMGQRSEAEQAVREALVVRPQGGNYHLGLAMVLRAEGKLTEARHEVESELAFEPQNCQARNLRDQITRQVQAAENPAGNVPANGDISKLK